MMTYAILFFVKILDNIVMTIKSIATYKNMKILSSVLIVISQLFFYAVIQQVISDNSIVAILIVSFAAGIGNLFAFIIADHFKKDDTWQNIVTSSDKEMLIKLSTMLRENKIKYLLLDTYNRRFEKSYTIIAYTKTKDESKLIDLFLNHTNAKYLRMINGIEVKFKHKNKESEDV